MHSEYDRDSEDFSDGEPSEVRWPPLGAADADVEEEESGFSYDNGRLKDLEEQQEKLNASLIALTSHFAQVQFRLKQIVDAPAQDKQALLKDLENFAFRGIPDVPDIPPLPSFTEDICEKQSAINRQKDEQRRVIGQLKCQLEELEHYAYEMGEADLPQSVLLEKQRVFIDELKGKLNLDVDDMDRLTFDDLRYQVDNAVSQLVNPLKMKEQLVLQLKTQIMDLERFIHFLQEDSSDLKKTEQPSSNDCTCSTHLPPTSKRNQNYANGKRRQVPDAREETFKKTLNMVRRTATLFQLFTIAQLGCGGQRTLNSLKNSLKVHHWGDLRARLELAVVNVLALQSERDAQLSCDDYSSDNDSSHSSWSCKVTRAVRKQLGPAICDLMHHGLVSVEASSSLLPLFVCLPTKGKGDLSMHAWELILRYYELKNGARFNATPMRRLSESFNLNMIGSQAVSHKQTLLSAIGQILSVHTQFKRSCDAQFKAFLCRALNCRKLVIWLRLVFRCQTLIDTYYEPWSYVARTGFEDSLQSLDKLTRVHFDLPVDTAVHHFQNIRDAF